MVGAFRARLTLGDLESDDGIAEPEIAQMANEEGWLEGGLKADLITITMEGYDHGTPYSLPVKPSPNLPNDIAVQLYPSLCFFEGTKMSVGRGTYFPFQVVGFPDSTMGDFSFTPVSIDGMSKNPKHQDKTCYGKDYRVDPISGLDLSPVVEFYEKAQNKDDYFNSYFNTLAGTYELKKQIEAGMNYAEIKATWQPGLAAFRSLRANYLLYPDFE